MADPIKAEWRGRRQGHRNYRFLQGVPARDLTQSEYDSLTDQQRKDLVATKLYRVLDEATVEQHVAAADQKEAAAQEAKAEDKSGDDKATGDRRSRRGGTDTGS